MNLRATIDIWVQDRKAFRKATRKKADDQGLHWPGCEIEVNARGEGEV